jgi:hypothetical protein
MPFGIMLEGAKHISEIRKNPHNCPAALDGGRE